MKRVAVVTSSPLFVEGGHLVMARALVQALRECGHEAELVLTPQNRFGRQGAAYAAAWLTDVGIGDNGRAVDQVISLRYPSYAVRHPNHVCWLNHTMREYDDRWEIFSAGLGWKNRLKERGRRALVHTADRRFLTKNVRKLFALSGVVKARLQRWLGADSEVLYPPAPQRAYRCDEYGDYIFAISRLVPLKRMSLLVEALAQPQARGVRCVIAGEGGEHAALAASIARLELGGRVTLAGRIDDRQLLDHLARCRAVCFPPLDEDYGFVTVEAFAARKPVVTCLDSGGPSELVIDAVNGRVVPPTPAALASALVELMDDVRTRGAHGQRRPRARGADVVGTRRGAAAGLMTPQARPEVLASGVVLIVLLAFALAIDFPKAAGGGFKGDEATYYVLGRSLARDFDFAYTHADLERVWEEFPGPEGIFLKTGKVVRLERSPHFPFVRWVKREDPERGTRLYFSKPYIYPLVAAPFVRVFGTNGFLVLHAFLLALDVLVACMFVRARTQSSRVGLALGIVFLAASVVPVYFVWLTPELFNCSLALYAMVLWAYKEVALEPGASAAGRFLRSPQSDDAAAVLLGVLTFSKPTHALLLAPVIGLAVVRRQFGHAARLIVLWGVITAGLFSANAAITGEFNYQGGNRKTFYHFTGFPFANNWETFDNSGPVRGREDVLVGDILVNRHSGAVFLRNLGYFVVGRFAGLVPYYFPGVLAAALFLASRSRAVWQWLVAGTIAGAIAMHLALWPFTYNGGGGPVGSRYFQTFYPLFLLLVPAGIGLGSSLAALAVGASFTAAIVLNPFFASANPGEHTKSGPLRLLPIELTLINDLPVAQHPERTKQPLGGTPPVLAYFPDDAAYNPEGEWFWVKGKARADVVLRAPVAAEPRTWVSKSISRLQIEIRNGGAANHVRVSTGAGTFESDLEPGQTAEATLPVRPGVPYHRDVQPTSYLYAVSISTSNGFVPFLDPPCQTRGACKDDSRYLGAMIHLVPSYTDADVTAR